MFSKEKGLILRLMLATVFHILNSIDSSEEMQLALDSNAVGAAIRFLDMSVQQTAYIAGRGDIESEIHLFITGICFVIYTCR